MWNSMLMWRCCCRVVCVVVGLLAPKLDTSRKCLIGESDRLNVAVPVLLQADGSNGQIASVFNQIYLFAHLKRYCLIICGVKHVSNISSCKKWKCVFCTICHFCKSCRDWDMKRNSVLCYDFIYVQLVHMKRCRPFHRLFWTSKAACLSDCVGVSVRAWFKIWTSTLLNKDLNSHGGQSGCSGEENKDTNYTYSNCSPVIMPNGVLAVTVMLSVSMPWTQSLRLSCHVNSIHDAYWYLVSILHLPVAELILKWELLSVRSC
jgi:hypothetical protein